MIYNVSMASNRASGVNHFPYIKWGFRVEIKSYTNRLGTEQTYEQFKPDTIQVEIDSLDKLREFISDFEVIVIDNSTITIYNDYIE